MIVLIVGPAGSGKSTVSKLLCDEFEKCALIEVDEIRHMIKAGEVSPFEGNKESQEQLSLGVKNTCSLARNFIDSGFTVVIDDVVSTTERMDQYFESLNNFDLNVFLLLPNEATTKKRDLEREEDCQMGERVVVLHKRFQELVKSEDRWIVIDSTDQQAKETVQMILKECLEK